ncbi:MAG: penicillin-binding transpeptidase domain-containing protein [Pelagimonas sp.]|uniref:penicillin-binding transpeptidase domain-containing protein n=1 Tax=Pelagimonas sp. TaxID=2073170 RepID=UPI003D6B8F4E
MSEQTHQNGYREAAREDGIDKILLRPDSISDIEDFERGALEFKKSQSSLLAALKSTATGFGRKQGSASTRRAANGNKPQKARAANGNTKAQPFVKIGLSFDGSRVATAALFFVATSAAAVTSSFVVPEQVNAVARVVYKMLPVPAMAATLQENMECAKDIRIVSEDGTVLGTTSAKPGCPNRDYRSLQPTLTGALAQAPFEEPAEGPLGGPGVVLSISVPGTARIPYYWVTQGIKVGGSGLEETTVEQVVGMTSPGTYDKIANRFYRVPAITARDFYSYEDKALFVTGQLICAQGMPGTGGFIALAGDHCAKLFGKESLEELIPAERCQLSGFRKSPLKVPGPKAEPVHMAAYTNQWADTIDRAEERCLSKLYDGSELEAHRAVLDVLPLPSAQSIRTSGNSAASKLPGAMAYLWAREAKTETIADGRIVTAIDPQVQKQLIEMLERNLNESIAPRLSPGLCAPGDDTCLGETINFGQMVAVLKPDGKISVRGVYQSDGGVLEVSGPSRRAKASTVKALMVPLFVKHGLTRLCREQVPHLSDQGYKGGKCSDDSSWVSLSDALASSSNLAFYWGLRQIADAEFNAWLEQFGFEVTHRLGEDLRRGVIIGNLATVTPDQLIRGMAAIVSGKPVFGPDSDERLDLTQDYSGNMLAASTRILSAPVSYGTVRAAKPILAAQDCDQTLVGKSGTADGTTGLARDRLLVLGALCKGHWHFAYGALGSPDADIPLGKDIFGSDLAKLTAHSLTKSIQ